MHTAGRYLRGLARDHVVPMKGLDVARWIDGRPPASIARWRTWLPPAVNYVLVVILAYVLARFAWRLGEMLFAPEPADTPAQVAVPGQQPGARGAEEVLWKEFMLFGREATGAAASRPATPAPKPVKPTEPVRLTLFGTIASESERSSLAVISVKGGDAEIYRIGDELQRGVILKEVSPWSVVVSVGGDDKTIQMVDVSNLPRRPAPARVPVASVGKAGTGERRITEPELIAKLQGYREALGTNPMSLMDKVRAYPVKRGGQPYGMRVRPGADRQLLGQLGLRSGDILISLNGVQLHDVKNLPDVVSQLRAQSEITMEYERGGNREEMRVVLDETGVR